MTREGDLDKWIDYIIITYFTKVAQVTCVSQSGTGRFFISIVLELKV